MTEDSNKAHKGHSAGRKLNFLKRHRVWFILLTSLLLLLTLILKEQIGDKAKEEADTLDSLRNMFYLRVDTLHAPDEIMANIDAVRLASPGSTIPPDQLEAQIDKQLKVDFRAGIDTDHMADALSKLAEGLDLNEEERATLEAIEKRNAERGKAFGKISDNLKGQVVRAEDYDAAVGIAADASVGQSKILDFGTALSDKADDKVRKLRKVNRWSSGIAYVLAIFLWNFSFLGKIYDLDLPEAGSA